MRKQPLTYIGLVFVLIGIATFVLTGFGIRALDAHAQWFLPHFFGPERAPSTTYDDLFVYATDLTKLRGRAEFRFYYTLTIFSIVLGGVRII